MDVARLNFSHCSPASRAAAATAVRASAAEAGQAVAVLADLAGPKVRLGELAGGSVELVAGHPFSLSGRGRDKPGTATGATVSYRRLAADVRPGDRVLLADGAAELQVLSVHDDAVDTEVVRGGTVRSRAGVSIPSERVTTSALTAKDRADIPRTRELAADLVAQSFVRCAEDVATLRQLLGADGPPIVAKIETRAAVDDFDRILGVADAVMIARGDMGVELPYE